MRSKKWWSSNQVDCVICVSNRNDPAVNSERACSQWAFAKLSNSVRESIKEEIPRTFCKFQTFGKSHPSEKLMFIIFKVLMWLMYVHCAVWFANMIRPVFRNAATKKVKKHSSMNRIVRCFHSLRWSTWNFKSTETIDGFSILEFYPSSLPPHLNPKSEWPMYNCGAGRSTPSPIWETSNNFCCQALPQRYPKVQRAPNSTY